MGDRRLAKAARAAYSIRKSKDSSIRLSHTIGWQAAADVLVSRQPGAAFADPRTVARAMRSKMKKPQFRSRQWEVVFSTPNGRSETLTVPGSLFGYRGADRWERLVRSTMKALGGKTINVEVIGEALPEQDAPEADFEP